MGSALKIACKNIWINKTRSLLTTLGIIIAVVAFITMVSLVEGATNSIGEVVSGMGVSSVSATIHNDHNNPISLKDLERWENCKEFDTVDANRMIYMAARFNTRTIDNAAIVECLPSTFELQKCTTKYGRLLSNIDIENSSYVCVINQAFAKKVVGYDDCVGETVYISGVPFRVVGVMNKMNSITSVIAMQIPAAYVPYGMLAIVDDTLGTDVTSFYVGAAEGFTVLQAQAKLKELLMDQLYGDKDAFTLESAGEMETTLKTIGVVLEVVLSGISLISLVVGGVGILNIMMVSVTERTKEIGIRKAIGAKRSTILLQFLVEAVILCLIGCLIGVLFSAFIVFGAAHILAEMDITVKLTFKSIAIVTFFCFLCGVVFGMSPANKAAKMKPIDALRST